MSALSTVRDIKAKRKDMLLPIPPDHVDDLGDCIGTISRWPSVFCELRNLQHQHGDSSIFC